MKSYVYKIKFTTKHRSTEEITNESGNYVFDTQDILTIIEVFTKHRESFNAVKVTGINSIEYFTDCEVTNAK